ncbi:MAG: hypothetical protein ACFB50_00555 [Rubrobacteraceae bacterium]
MTLRKLSREPEGGKEHRWMLAIGCLVGLAGAVSFLVFPDEMGFVGLGLAILGLAQALGATAELLPRDRRGPATLLRALSFTLLGLCTGIMLAALWLMFT